VKAFWIALVAVVVALLGFGVAADVVDFVTGGNSDTAYVLLGDVLIFAGLVATGIIYYLERQAARKRDIASVLTMLKAVRDGLLQWGEVYFQNGYDEKSAVARAQQDFDLIIGKAYGQVFLVPVEPLTALIERPGEGDLVRKETIEAANVALWRIGVFNQFVHQQTDFNTRHLSEIADPSLPQTRRVVLAGSARWISTMLHMQGIGRASWYQKLKAELETNIEELQRRA
jgi:hypothetical protein